MNFSKSQLHYWYLYIIGGGGWLWVLTTFFISNHEQLFQTLLGSFVIALFFALAITARFTSFHLTESMEIAIDSAFYLASTAIIGSKLTAIMALICMTFDSFRKNLLGFRHEKKQTITYMVGHIVFNAGLTSLGILACGYLFGFDSNFLMSQRDESRIWLLPIMSFALLSLHYILFAFHLWLDGATFRYVFRHIIVRGIFFEILTVPLSLVMVASFDPQRPTIIVLLGITYILFAIIVKRLSYARLELQKNLLELETAKNDLQINLAMLKTINRVGNSITENLEMKELYKEIAAETLSLIDNTSLFLIGEWDESTQRVQCAVFDGNGKMVGSKDLKKGEGLTGYVMTQKEEVFLNDLQNQKKDFQLAKEFDDPTIYSWLGLPLVFHGETIGVISLQSQEKNAYSENDIYLLRGLVQQAAIAVKNARLYELATVESLTGLYVRRYFDIRLQEEWHRSHRYDSDFALILLDIDNFKKINDRYGHIAGDKVLKAVGQIVKANMRTIDIPARYGGEEFAMILPKTSLENAFVAAERIRKDIESIEITFQESTFHVSGSFGVASYPESSPSSPFELVDRADKALYQAKKLGKNRVETFFIAESTKKVSMKKVASIG